MSTQSSGRKTIVLIARSPRLHLFYREMAQDLARDHRVVVIALEPPSAALQGLDGVDVRACPVPGMPGANGHAAALRGAPLDRAVQAVERELGVRLHQAAGNYLMYGRLTKQLGGHWRFGQTPEQLRQAFVGAHRLVTDLFDELSPDVVFYESIDTVVEFVACAAAYRRGIFPLDVRFAPLSDGNIMISFGLQRRSPVLEHLYRRRELIEPASYEAADRLIGNAREAICGTQYAALHQRIMAASSLWNARKIRSVLMDVDRLTFALRNARWHYRIAKNRAWLSRWVSGEPPGGPYVAFCLSHVPEGSTCAQAPRWVDQGLVTEQLAVNGPSHLRIVVKEHPRSFGRRGPEFFGPLRDLPNVTVCHPGVDNYTLVSRAAAVVAITGTTGLEAMLLGRPVGVLGRPFYSIYAGVRLLTYPEDIFRHLEDAAWQSEPLSEERRAFFAAYIQSQHAFGVGDGPTAIYPARGGARWAAALRHAMRFLELHRVRPSDIDRGF